MMEVPWRGALCLLILYFCSYPSIADSACKRTCRGDGGPFLQGNVYKYHLEGSSVMQLPGSPDEVTSLSISATGEVFAESKCQHVLKLSNVEVKGPDGKKYDGLSAECAKPIRFSYDDGKLAELCGQSDESGTSLNIKRAIISLMSSVKNKENDGDSATEPDVFGVCPTEFSISKQGSKVTISKTKNLNRCALREDFNFPFPTTPHQAIQSSFGSLESSPLLGAQLKVTQELDGGVLQKATGEEVYNYRPLVNPEAGAIVKVSYTINLEGSNPGAIPANVNTRKGIFFETVHPEKGIKNQATIAAALQKAVAAIDPVATPEAAKEFAYLVHVIEQGSKADIIQAYNAAQGKTAKNLFLDGLLYAGSAESVEAAAELLSSKKIPEESALLWYLDLNFVKHVSTASLTSLLPLLSGSKVPYQAYLGIGSVAGKFCIQHPEQCHSSPEFKALLEKLAAPLAGGCKVNSHEKENNIIASLKGLGNTRHLTDEVAQKVSKCAADKSAKTRVRVAALEAFHADASKPVLKQQALLILHDLEEDAELRIKAYLSLVENPCPEVADTVKSIIDSEPINQVGSFIVSHLRSIRASVSPEKEAAKKFLGNIISKKKFPFDQRKFSRNVEMSYNLDALNMGAVVDYNRIYSQNSFLPRSVSLNMTTQLFGHSINLAEVALRTENLEWHLEKYLGTKGILNSRGSELADEYADKAEKSLNETLERHKRSTLQQQTFAATKNIKFGPDYEDRHTDLDFSLKLFGSDIAWVNYDQDEFDFEGLKNKVYGKMDESVDNAKDIDIDYKKARTFLDAGLTYPTGLGLGLKIKVNGNYAVNLQVNGKIDIRAIMNNPKNAHVAFQVVPSGSLELATLLSVDADVFETGVKVSANLHSSTGSDLTIKVLDGYGVDVKLGLPVKKQDILNFHSDVVSVIREKNGDAVESPVKFNVKRQEHGGCFDQLNTMTGLTFCGEISVPLNGFKALSPAYGPTKASIRIEKEDESLTAYHLRAFYNNKQEDQISFDVLLDTPNSKTHRKFALNAKGSLKPQKHVLITFESPITTTISFEGLVIDTDVEQAISAKLKDDSSEYSIKIGAHVSGDISRRKYEPILEYKYPEATKSDRAWLGRKGVKGGRQQQSAVGITGAVYVEQTPGTQYRKFELKSVTLTTSKLKVTVDGTITLDADLVATDLKASYDKDSYTLNSKVQKLGEQKYIAKVDFLSTQYPDLGGSVRWEYERTPHKIENKLVIVHGPDLNSEVSRISIAQLLTFKYDSAKVYEFHTENTVSYPLLAFSAAVKGNAAPKNLMYDVSVTYDKAELKSMLDAKVGAKHSSDYSIDFEGKAFDNSIDLSLKHDRVSATKSKFTNSLELKPGGKYQLNALVENSDKSGEIYRSLDLEAKLPQDPKSVKVKTEFKQNSKEYEVEFKLIAANKHLVDFEIELHEKAEPSGKFKLVLSKYIDSHGTYEVKGGKGSGAFHINVLKTGRKIEGKADFTKYPSRAVVSGELLWDAKKDPSKKIVFNTDTAVSEKSIDTKNSLQVLDYKTEVNVKGSLDGTLADGTLVGDAEVVLPSGRILTGKVNRVLHMSSEDNKIEGTWEVAEYASKTAQPQKLTLKIAAKNINPARIQFDGQVDLTYLTPKKEDLVLHFVGKKVPQGDKWTIAGQGSVTGSLVKKPVHSKLSAEVSEQLLKGQFITEGKFSSAHYDFELKAGSDIEVTSNGKINQDQFNNDIELKLPADLAIKSAKWHLHHLSVEENGGEKTVTKNALYWNEDKFVKFNSESFEKSENGYGKITWESHEQSPHTLTYNINSPRGDKADLDLSLEWEGKKADFCLKVDASSSPVYLKITSSVPDHGKFEFDLSAKNDGDSTDVSVSAIGNDKKVAFYIRQSKSKISPSMDIGLELPSGKSRFYVKLETKGDQHFLIDSKVAWFTHGGGAFDLNGEVNVKSLDDLFIKLFINSPKLNWNNVEFEAGRQLTKSSAKTVYFRGKANEKKISGSFTLVPKEDNLYEGSGVFKVGEDAYPLQFKLKYDVARKDQREVLLDMKAGKYQYYANTVVVMDEATGIYKVDSENKYCNGDNCKTEELRVFANKKGPMEYDAKINIKFSISLMFLLEHPLFLNAHLKRKFAEYDRFVEAQYGPDKIQYHDYLDRNLAGAELILPKRTIAGEVTFKVEPNQAKKYLIEASFWLDKKNAAADKTSVLLLSESSALKNSLTSSSEARFSTPGMKDLSLKSELSVNYKDHTANAKFEADVFAKNDQKLVIEYVAAGKKGNNVYTANDNIKIHSKGLNIDTQLQRNMEFAKKSMSYVLSGYYIDSKQNKREGVFKIASDTKNAEILLKLPEAVVYSEETSITVDREGNPNKAHYHGTGKAYILGCKFETDVDFKLHGSHLKYTVTAIYMKENNPKITFDVGVDLGQLAELNMKFNDKPMFGVEVALDEAHFLKSKYNYNTDLTKEYLTLEKETFMTMAKEASRIAKNTGAKVAEELTDRVEDCRQALPNLNQAIQHYKKQLQHMEDEFASNENIKDLMDFLKNSFGTVFSQISTILSEVADIVQKLFTISNEAIKKINESIKAIIPKLKESFENASDIVIKLLDDLLEYGKTILTSVLDKIKEFEEEINEIVDVTTGFLSDVSKLIAETISGIHREVKDFLLELWRQIETHPIFYAIAEIYEELKLYKVPDKFWTEFDSLKTTIINLSPTQELQQFVRTFAKYFEQFMKHQSFDKAEAAKQLLKDFAEAVESLIPFVLVFDEEAVEPKYGQPPKFLLPPAVGSLVVPPGTVEFSLLNWIRSPDLPSVSDFYYTYRAKLSRINYLPPFYGNAHVIGGSEFATFDGKRYSFKGSCSYILSTDAIDGNFTLIANLEPGKLKSLTVIDHENSVELFSDNKILVNGKPSELPGNAGDLTIFRNFYAPTLTAIVSKSGIYINCVNNLDMCALTTDGYYFGKTRGLLGAYNYEPYDDTILPSGKVAKSTAEFVSSWKVDPQCADDGAVQEQPAPPAEQCTKLFSGDSSLSPCFPYGELQEYRAVCNRKVAEASGQAKEEAACKVALYYAGYCKFVHLLSITLPDYCDKCQIGSQTVPVGESLAVKVPQKEADVVIVIEQLQDNEEIFNHLITPLVSTLRNDLKEKGILDVNFALIGYGHQHYPAIYTFNGKYGGFTGTSKDIYFAKEESEVQNPKISDKLREIKKKIMNEFGKSKVAKAFEYAFDYPFRPEAVKTIVGAMSSGCDKAILPFQSVRLLMHKLNLLNSGVTLNMITSLEDLSLEGKDEKAAANIVGFDSNAVYNQGEAKKKVLRGDEEALQHLKYTSNICTELTLGTNGAVFSSTNFIKGKPNLRKNFLQVLSSKITESLTNEELVTDCKCVMARGRHAAPKCKVVSRREKEPLIRGVKGVKG